MAGTVNGGRKAAETNIERHGLDFYREIGRRGGSAPAKYPKGFAADRELASQAGRIGGRRSRRGKGKKQVEVKATATNQVEVREISSEHTVPVRQVKHRWSQRMRRWMSERPF